MSHFLPTCFNDDCGFFIDVVFLHFRKQIYEANGLLFTVLYISVNFIHVRGVDNVVSRITSFPIAKFLDLKLMCFFQLVEGKAEIFGTEITTKQRYKFIAGTQIAVFTYHGCKVVIHGNTEGAYTSKDTPMRIHLNIHAALEQMRQRATLAASRGPRVRTGIFINQKTFSKMNVNA